MGKFPLRYMSRKQAFQAADAVETINNWLPPRGPMQGRLVVDFFELVCDFSSIDVGAGGALAGEDRYRLAQRISVYDKAGFDRWGLRGDQSRVMGFALMGPNRVPEYADIAAAAAAADARTSIWIPMLKPLAFEGKDYSLPADMFDRIEIQSPNLGTTGNGAGIGGGAITVNSGNFYVVAHCHEEFATILHARDQVRATLFDSTTENEIIVDGRLQELTLHKAGADGGASLANIGTVRVEGLIPKELDYADVLVPNYEFYRGAAKNSSATQGNARYTDPHLNDKAVPVLFGMGAGVLDGPIVRTLRIETPNNAIASVVALHRAVLPRGDAQDAHQMGIHRMPAGAFRVKTKGKTKRGRDAWTAEQRAFLPMSAPLRAA